MTAKSPETMTRREIREKYGVTDYRIKKEVAPISKEGRECLYPTALVKQVFDYLLTESAEAVEEPEVEEVVEVVEVTPEVAEEVPDSESEPTPPSQPIEVAESIEVAETQPSLIFQPIPTPEPYEWIVWDKDQIIDWLETYLAGNKLNCDAALAQLRESTIPADRAQDYCVKVLYKTLIQNQKTIYIKTPEMLKAMPSFDLDPCLCIDTETYLVDANHSQSEKAVHWQDSKVRLIQIYSPSLNTSFVLDVYLLEQAGAKGLLRSTIEGIAALPIPKYAHGGVFDSVFIVKSLELSKPLDLRCTIVLSAVLKKGLHMYYPGKANSLDACLQSLGLDLYQGTKTLMQKSGFSPYQNLILNQEQIEYASKDSIAVYLLAIGYIRFIKRQELLPRLKYEWMGDQACQLLTRTGFPLSPDINDVIGNYQKVKDLLQQSCTDLLGKPFSEKSPIGLEVEITPKPIKPTELDKVKKWWLNFLEIRPEITGSDKDHIKFQSTWTLPAIELIDAVIDYNPKVLAPLVRWLLNKLREVEEVEPYVKVIDKKSQKVTYRFDLLVAGLNFILNSESKTELSPNPFMARRLTWLLVKAEFIMYFSYSRLHTWHTNVATQLATLKSIERFSYPSKSGTFRAHAIYSTIGGRASNGRTSAKDAPLQIIPRPGEVNKHFGLPSIKEVFTPESEKCFLVYDWSGCHGTIAAYLAGEDRIFDLTKDGIKFHFLTVQGFLKSLYNIDSELTEIKEIKGDKTHKLHSLVSNLYNMAKNVYYSFINFASPKSIQGSIFDRSQIIVPIDECKDYLDTIRLVYPKISQWMETQRQLADQRALREKTITGGMTGLVTTLPSIDGVLLKFAANFNVNPYNGNLRESFYPPALTSSIYQNWEGCILKSFMRLFAVLNAKPKHPWNVAELAHFNHDELILQVPADKSHELSHSILGALESHIRKYVPTYEGEKGLNYHEYIHSDHW